MKPRVDKDKTTTYISPAPTSIRHFLQNRTYKQQQIIHFYTLQLR